jgi:hypothetical protein
MVCCGLCEVRELGRRWAQQSREVFAAWLDLAARGEDAAQAGKAGEIYVFEERSVGDEESGSGIFQLIADLALAVGRD